MSVNVTMSVGQFAQGYCWQGPQQYANDLVAILTATIAGNFSGIIIGPNLPSPSDQDKAWLRTNNDGTPTRLYVYLGGWLSLHPVPANSLMDMIWTGTENALWSYDGGDGTDPSISPPTSTTGAMWARDTKFNFAFPVGIGTNGVTYDGNPATVINPGSTGGEERHKLKSFESGVPAHTHDMLNDWVKYSGGAQALSGGGGSQGDGGGVTGQVSGGAQDAFASHQNMPPYVGVIFARRTARIYYSTS